MFRRRAAVAGAAFFWAFEILVFLVLLNFLLAICVDAFGQVGWAPAPARH